ncbi:hypothetical protein [Nesterenkonia aerolata]|nr:hypothetical protein [Nesterenkonia sp. LY-0111]
MNSRNSAEVARTPCLVVIRVTCSWTVCRVYTMPCNRAVITGPSVSPGWPVSHFALQMFQVLLDLRRTLRHHPVERLQLLDFSAHRIQCQAVLCESLRELEMRRDHRCAEGVDRAFLLEEGDGDLFHRRADLRILTWCDGRHCGRGKACDHRFAHQGFDAVRGQDESTPFGPAEQG